MIIMETKSEIRSRVLRLRENLDTQERERACVLMTERILGHQWFYGSDIFLGFAGFGSEIDTEPLLRDALRMGKQVYLPRVEGNAMDFYRIYSLTELTEGYNIGACEYRAEILLFSGKRRKNHDADARSGF